MNNDDNDNSNNNNTNSAVSNFEHSMYKYFVAQHIAFVCKPP